MQDPSSNQSDKSSQTPITNVDLGILGCFYFILLFYRKKPDNILYYKRYISRVDRQKDVSALFVELRKMSLKIVDAVTSFWRPTFSGIIVMLKLLKVPRKLV